MSEIRAAVQTGQTLERIEEVWPDPRTRKVAPEERAEHELGRAVGLARVTEETATATIRLLSGPATIRLLNEVKRLSREIESRSFSLAEKNGYRDNFEETRETSLNQGLRMMNTYLAANRTAGDGLDYIAMLEAESLGHWAIFAKMEPEPVGGRLLSTWAIGAIRAQMNRVVKAAVEFNSTASSVPEAS